LDFAFFGSAFAFTCAGAASGVAGGVTGAAAGAAGEAAGTATAGSSTWEAPQFRQNFALGATLFPHSGQYGMDDHFFVI
jgi:hypothetical protein